MHCGEGTFLRVELCQRPSYSLHAAVSITASKPSDNEIFTCKGFHRATRLALARHMVRNSVEVEASFDLRQWVLSRPLVVDLVQIVLLEEISVQR